MDLDLDLDLGFPGKWRFPTSINNCCIYRVPNSMRSINPEAYTPQLVLLGPLNYTLISQASKSRGDITNTKSTGYLNMQEYKKIYLKKFTERATIQLRQETSIDDFRRKIEGDEKQIRESYSESTAWINPKDFMDMILNDCIFILEHILRVTLRSVGREVKTGDPLLDVPCLEIRVKKDLIILENQLPYFVLEKLFKSIYPNRELGRLVFYYFGLQNEIGNETEFLHFTDLLRCVRVAKIPKLPPPTEFKYINMYNAVKLHSGGVKFKVVENKFPLYARFEDGCLELPCLEVDDGEEMTLRNIMAFEQCHVPYEAHVCNYIIFLDYLIDNEKDVELLVEKEIIKNSIGQPSAIAEMVNKLCLGHCYCGSYCADIADKVTAYYNDPLNKKRAVLKSIYFSNVWIGTATVAAMLLLLLTLTQTVTSIMQVT
ncbi:hypothetical protein V5N11_020070 [Cardamine amara subsp. amara]|uniref:Uncharacterized protein n=1 Tax=Cardamine amara subsp. amara TaxID=228776 RepID=A0ABD0ZJL6_CARAN